MLEQSQETGPVRGIPRIRSHNFITLVLRVPMHRWTKRVLHSQHTPLEMADFQLQASLCIAVFPIPQSLCWIACFPRLHNIGRGDLGQTKQETTLAKMSDPKKVFQVCKIQMSQIQKTNINTLRPCAWPSQMNTFLCVLRRNIAGRSAWPEVDSSLSLNIHAFIRKLQTMFYQDHITDCLATCAYLHFWQTARNRGRFKTHKQKASVGRGTRKMALKPRWSSWRSLFALFKVGATSLVCGRRGLALVSSIKKEKPKKEKKTDWNTNKRPTGTYWPLSTQIGHGLPCIACARSRGPDRSLCSKNHQCRCCRCQLC